MYYSENIAQLARVPIVISALVHSLKEMLVYARQEFVGLESVDLLSLNREDLATYFVQYSLLKDFIGDLDDYLIRFQKAHLKLNYFNSSALVSNKLHI